MLPSEMLTVIMMFWSRQTPGRVCVHRHNASGRRSVEGGRAFRKSAVQRAAGPMALLVLLFGYAASGALAAPFEDVTAEVGLDLYGGSIAAWGDYNGDGWVDLYNQRQNNRGTVWRNEGGKFAMATDALELR